MHAIARSAKERLPEFAPPQIGSLLCAFAKVDVADFPLRAALSSACAARLHEFSAQDLSKTSWSFVAVSVAPEARAAVAEDVLARLPCDAADVASLARAVAVLAVTDGALTGALA